MPAASILLAITFQLRSVDGQTPIVLATSFSERHLFRNRSACSIRCSRSPNVLSARALLVAAGCDGSAAAYGVADDDGMIMHVISHADATSRDRVKMKYSSAPLFAAIVAMRHASIKGE